MTFFWSEMVTRRVQQLRKEGFSASKIADKISKETGQEVTRNAVIGKMARLEDKTKKKTEAPPKDQTPPPPSLDIPLEKLEKDQCKFPYGDHGSFVFCGHPSLPGKPYCEYHVKKCYIQRKYKENLDMLIAKEIKRINTTSTRGYEDDASDFIRQGEIL